MESSAPSTPGSHRSILVFVFLASRPVKADEVTTEYPRRQQTVYTHTCRCRLRRRLLLALLLLSGQGGRVLLNDRLLLLLLQSLLLGLLLGGVVLLLLVLLGLALGLFFTTFR